MNTKVESRKQEIIKAAAKLFKEKGYSAVTMRDLASALGIKAASLYNHISSKQDLLETIIITIAEEFTKGMAEINATPNSSVYKLKQIIKLHVEISSRNIYGMAALNNDWMHLETQRHYYKSLRIDYENQFRAILQKGIDSGEIININPDVMLFSLLTTLSSLYLWIPKKEDLDIDTFISDLNRTLIEGVVL